MVTPIYAAMLSLILIALSINVIKARKKFGAALGDVNNLEIKRRIRAQANFSEYAPIFLILLACAEYNSLAKWILHSCGVVFLLGRMMHAYSLLKAEQYHNDKLITSPVWRIRGMQCTLSTITLLSIIILIQSMMILV